MRQLMAYSAKMGPDPASIATCMIGGHSLQQLQRHVLRRGAERLPHARFDLTFVLPSGTVIDTADPRADELVPAREPRLAAGHSEAEAQIETEPGSTTVSARKYQTKNTTGYSLNAFIDFERRGGHLPARADRLGRHAGLHRRGRAEHGSRSAGQIHRPASVSRPLRCRRGDRASARRGRQGAGDHGPRLAALGGGPAGNSAPRSRSCRRGRAGLLVEFQAANEGERAALEAVARQEVAGFKLLEPAVFTHQAAEQAALWKIRAGMFPSVGAVRKSGTTVIIEDVAFPIEQLADAAVDLTKLFLKHGYDNGIIFGHAKDGNLHFVITQSFNDQKAIDQYARFIDDLIKLVVERYDGALKAEHGTGRNMAPFVEAEWGGEAYRS